MRENENRNHGETFEMNQMCVVLITRISKPKKIYFYNSLFIDKEEKRTPKFYQRNLTPLKNLTSLVDLKQNLLINKRHKN